MMSNDTVEIDVSVSSNRHISDSMAGLTISIDCKRSSKENFVQSDHVSVNKVAEDEPKESSRDEISKNVKKCDTIFRDRVMQQSNSTNQVKRKCNYFKNYGKCKFENECDFSHDIASASSSVGRHSEEKFPTAARTDNAVVKHTEEKHLSVEARDQQSEFGMQVSKDIAPYGKVSDGLDGKYINNADGSYLNIKSLSDVSCKFFMDKMGCRFGDRCQYKHYRSVGDAGSTSVNDLSHIGNTETKKAEVREVNELTVHIDQVLSMENTETNDSKTNKENVEQQSGNDKKNAKANRVKPAKKCSFYLQPKGCRRGDDCKFRHSGKEEIENKLEASNNVGYSKMSNEASNNVDNSKSPNEASNNVDSWKSCDEASNNVGHKKLSCETSNKVDNRKSSSEASNNADNRKLSNEASHQNSNTDVRKESGTRKTRKCKYHERGKCRRGDNCIFLHRPKRDTNISNDASSSVDNDSILNTVASDHSHVDVRKDDKRVANTSETVKSKESSSGGKQIRKCHFFQKPRGCFKDDCPFLHEKFVDKEIKTNQVNSNGDNDVSKDDEHRIYVMSSSGENIDIAGSEENEKCGITELGNSHILTVRVNNSMQDKMYQPPTANLVFRESRDLSSSQNSLRNTEFQQLERRFLPENKCSMIQAEPSVIYLVYFQSSDPDWAFVVKEFLLRVEFPADYPKKMFNVSFEDDDFFPEGFTDFLNEDLQVWLEDREISRDEYDLAFRPFLKWLDRYLESLVLKAGQKVKKLIEASQCGITLIPHDKILPNRFDDDSGSSDEVNDEKEVAEDNGTMLSEPSDSGFETECNKSDVNSLLAPPVLKSDMKLSNKVKSGTEVKFSHLAMNENVGFLSLRNVLLIVQCVRCKTRGEFKLEGKKKASSACKKCHAAHIATFHPEIVHQYSHVVGYFHLEGCKAFDLVLLESVLIVQCLNCLKENTKKGMAYGKKGDYWCQFCHTKIEINAQAVKFTQLQKSGEPVQTVKPAAKKAVKYPNIKEGEPLPSNGTCKHYKKSYRWLRFPCCGKIYPCDVCHEEGEENDHEMKFATRMICGFCSKEQHYSKDKPCIKCNSNVTKSRSSHWEGGQGCRNKTTMDKKDRRKTAGLGKTVSRKKANE